MGGLLEQFPWGMWSSSVCEAGPVTARQLSFSGRSYHCSKMSTIHPAAPVMASGITDAVRVTAGGRCLHTGSLPCGALDSSLSAAFHVSHLPFFACLVLVSDSSKRSRSPILTCCFYSRVAFWCMDVASWLIRCPVDKLEVFIVLLLGCTFRDEKCPCTCQFTNFSGITS